MPFLLVIPVGLPGSTTAHGPLPSGIERAADGEGHSSSSDLPLSWDLTRLGRNPPKPPKSEKKHGKR
eukprot:4963953-Amphidinium_carterae.1